MKPINCLAENNFIKDIKAKDIKMLCDKEILHYSTMYLKEMKSIKYLFLSLL